MSAMNDPGAQHQSKKPKLETTPRVRVCDKCRSLRKACSGTLPCVTCARRGIPCEWSRGPPPTPPPATSPGLDGADHDETFARRSVSEHSMNALANPVIGPDRGFTASNVPPRRHSASHRSHENAMSNNHIAPHITPDGRVGNIVSGRLLHAPSNRNTFDSGDKSTQAYAGQKRRSSLDMELLEEFNRGSRESGTHSPSSSRNSPEQDAHRGESQTTTFDFGFLRRAITKFHQQSSKSQTAVQKTIFMAGDTPLSLRRDPERNDVELPARASAMVCLKTYFNVAMVSWRFLHQGQVESWMKTAYNERARSQINDKEWQSLGYAKKSILLGIFALARYHEAEFSTSPSDDYFQESVAQLERETGSPTLESVQARLTHMFYLLASSRMSQAWYTLGTVIQLSAMLELDRTSASIHEESTSDYIETECRKRTFWTVYILEKYFSFMMGSSGAFQDAKINQSLPEAVNDEFMTPEGSSAQRRYNSNMSALIGHAKLSQLLSQINNSIYSATASLSPVLVSASHYHTQSLSEWKTELPAIFGNDEIRASDLAPILGRQSRSLTLAYAHAVIMATRPFLTASAFNSNPAGTTAAAVRKCISAARVVIETALSVQDEEPHFQMHWWTAYITFCALVVTNVYAIQRLSTDAVQPEMESDGMGRDLKLFSLAEKLQEQFLGGSHGDGEATQEEGPVVRRYRCVLEELRAEYRRQKEKRAAAGAEDKIMADVGDGLPLDGPREDGFKSEAWEPANWTDLDAWVHKNRRLG